MTDRHPAPRTPSSNPQRHRQLFGVELPREAPLPQRALRELEAVLPPADSEWAAVARHTYVHIEAA
jgi:hypothetical protein